ncbi:MAG: hypothetical protein A2Z17_00190 [Gammaproteobacteria bacterium RBG_16_66_13]|nr:MAG: hypothetical protein A2Z17_00190 [Gammaproteobacteria bacterium RBG_16_66_13]
MQIGGQTTLVQALQGAVAGVTFGASFGVGQWLVLRPHMQRAGRWVLATAVGYAVVFVLGTTLIPGGEAVELGPASQIAFGAVLGAAVAIPPGLLQWLLVLRRQLPGAGWWIPGSAVSWSVGFAISFALRLWLGELTFIAGPAVAIGLTGLALARLLQQGSPARP